MSAHMTLTERDYSCIFQWSSIYKSLYVINNVEDIVVILVFNYDKSLYIETKFEINQSKKEDDDSCESDIPLYKWVSFKITTTVL